MTSLSDIPGLDAEMIGILRDVGIETPADFTLMPADLVCRAWTEGLPAGRAHPAVADVEQMQESLRRKALPGGGSDPSFPRANPLPVAEALSSRQLTESGIEASAVPVARILGDPTEADLVGATPQEEAPRREGIPTGEPASPRSRVATKEPPGPRSQGKKPAQVVERVPAGKKPGQEGPEPAQAHFTSTEERSREETDFERKNRGMTLKNPGRVLLGALATLLSNLLALAGFATIATALFYEFLTEARVPAWLAWGLLAFPAALLVFLTVATRPRCRLCGQRLFVPRQCRKHERAHRSIFGYATALALHVVFRRWFRCSLCGTKQKLN